VDRALYGKGQSAQINPDRVQVLEEVESATCNLHLVPSPSRRVGSTVARMQVREKSDSAIRI
jgi:hypothetical protein